MATEFEKMVDFLDLSYPMKKEIVPCLIGPVGIGKTAAVNKHAENVGAKKVVTIIASQILPSEVSGLTMPDAETKSMQIYDHYRLASLEDGDILFFDELLEADQSVLSACLTLIESRMMMSGRKLPDIQIIAATNPTIKPGSLKENIRQRFMFREFDVDKQGVHDYILKKTGLDLTSDVLNQIRTNGSSYNLLSPRSLTKLCEWMSATSGNDMYMVARMINEMFSSNIGSAILKAKTKINDDYKVKIALNGIIKDNGMDEAKFENCTLKEMVDILQEMPEWEEISKALANMELEETDAVQSAHAGD